MDNTQNILLLILFVQIIILLAEFIFFAISTATDIIIFKKLFRTKSLARENNGEIHEHDKMLIDLQEQIEEIKHHE